MSVTGFINHNDFKDIECLASKSFSFLKVLHFFFKHGVRYKRKLKKQKGESVNKTPLWRTMFCVMKTRPYLLKVVV